MGKLIIICRCEDCHTEWVYYKKSKPKKCDICGGKMNCMKGK